MRKKEIASDNIYHIYNRGVEKRVIFKNNQDNARFIKGLVIFNDTKPVDDFNDRFRKILNKSYERKPIVDIMAFCLMPNHYHLLLKQRVNGGITKFMRKLGVGYVNYFNLKQERVGTLFQGKFKSVLVDDNSQLLYVPHYIHLNPLDLIFPNWRDGKIINKKLAMEFLNRYEWSSYNDYVGGNNFDLALNKNLISEYFNKNDYRDDLNDFLDDFNMDTLTNLTLE